MLREDEDMFQPDRSGSAGQEPRAVGAKTRGMDTSMGMEIATFG